MLTKDDLRRYSRQLETIGFDGQQRLKNARILVAGMGGLGSPVSMYLAAAGVGYMRIIDDDIIDETNFNRQILHWQTDLGQRKVKSASEKLASINPNVKLEAVSAKIEKANVKLLSEDVDLIVDAMDNFDARYLLNSAAVSRRIPYFHGAVSEFYGQATTLLPGRTACLRCIFPEGPKKSSPQVLGATAGVIASIEATEVIKYLTGKGKLLTNRLLLWDGLRTEAEIIEVKRNPHCTDCRDI